MGLEFRVGLSSEAIMRIIGLVVLAIALAWSAWQSDAAPLVVPAAGGNGTTARVSVASDGTQTDGGSGNSAISRDGAWIVFTSAATNLVPGDSNSQSDLFLHEIATGSTTRA